jgi:putative endonuclease
VKAKDAVGRYGEDVAARYLLAAGWEVVERNWRCPQGEIDIVALHGTELVVVEVKTRSSDRFGHPAEAVTAVKLARLRRLAAQWLDAHDLRPTSVRIDVIAVHAARSGPARVEHLCGVL